MQVKDESDRLGLPAFKILGASWAVERTLRGQPATQTLPAASAGNHGRAVAHAAAPRGPAAWHSAVFHRLHDGQAMDRRQALREMTRRCREHMHSNEPVHTWPTD